MPVDTAKLLSKALGPMTDNIYTPEPANARVARLTANVDRVQNGIADSVAPGRFETLHHRDNDPKLPIHAEASVEGVGFFETKSRGMRSLLLVFEGSFRNMPPYDKPQASSAVVEWKWK